MSNRYEKEIEEILKNAGESTPTGTREETEQPADDLPIPKRQPRQRRGPTAYGRGAGLPAITPGMVLLAGLMVLLVAVLVKVAPLVWVGLAMVAIGYVAHFMRPRSAPVQKYWRQRPLETPPQSAWDRLKRWMRG